MISFEVLNLQECCLRAEAADMEVVCNNSMCLLKVSIIKIICENPISVGNGRIVSIAQPIRVIGATEDRPNRGAL